MSFLGIPIEVELWRFVVAQVFGVITLVFNFVAFQIKNQRKYLLTTSIGSTFWTLMYVFVGAQLPILIAASFSALRGLVFWWIFAKDSPARKKAGKIFLYVALAGALLGSVIGIVVAGGELIKPETLALQIVMLGTALLFIVGQYLPSKHYLRIFALFYATTVLLTNTPLDTFNPMGILIEAANIISIFVFYVFWFRRNFAKRELVEIKETIAGEIAKINNKTEQTASLMPAARFESLVAKMVKYEIISLDKDKLVNFKGIEQETLAVLESIKTAQDAKESLSPAEEGDKSSIFSKDFHSRDAKSAIGHIKLF
jgi:hypothetical protein